MNKEKLFTGTGAALLAAGLMFSSGPTEASWQEVAPAAASPVRPGDDALSCQQLTAESTALQGELNQMTQEITSAATGQIRAARAAQAASTASSIASGLASNIPIIGGLIGSIGSRVATAGVEAQQDKMLELAERMSVRGGEIGARLQRVEILRSARCGTGQGLEAVRAADVAADD